MIQRLKYGDIDAFKTLRPGDIIAIKNLNIPIKIKSIPKFNIHNLNWEVETDSGTVSAQNDITLLGNAKTISINHIVDYFADTNCSFISLMEEITPDVCLYEDGGYYYVINESVVADESEIVFNKFTRNELLEGVNIYDFIPAAFIESYIDHMISDKLHNTYNISEEDLKEIDYDVTTWPQFFKDHGYQRAYTRLSDFCECFSKPVKITEKALEEIDTVPKIYERAIGIYNEDIER